MKRQVLAGMLTREDLEKREELILSPYAMKSAESMGREHSEEEHPYRTAFQRDKDRIVHSTAFRRLEYKTQVFVNHEGDYYRTRLTHTLEVSQIARTIARSLGLNEDLVEAIALAHDLGHTPFGHTGEDTLSELMKDKGGFDHNSHGLRVVDLLEKRYPDFDGLNLSSEVRRGIIRHTSPFDLNRVPDAKDIKGPYLLEIQVVDAADEIAYDNHDLDDGLKSGLLKVKDLEDIPLWDMAEKVSVGKDMDQGPKRPQIIRKLIDFQVSDLVSSSQQRISSSNIQTVNDLSSDVSKGLIGFSDEMKDLRAPLKATLYDRLYNHYRVVRMSRKASRFLKSLFQIYVEGPDQLPGEVHAKIKERGKFRVISDYIAGMTDRYALDQYQKFFEPYERV